MSNKNVTVLSTSSGRTTALFATKVANSLTVIAVADLNLVPEGVSFDVLILLDEKEDWAVAYTWLHGEGGICQIPRAWSLEEALWRFDGWLYSLPPLEVAEPRRPLIRREELREEPSPTEWWREEFTYWEDQYDQGSTSEVFGPFGSKEEAEKVDEDADYRVYEVAK